MTSARSAPPASLDEVMQVDRHRLVRQWQQLNQQRANADRWDHWETAVRDSIARVHSRHDSIPPLAFDEELPITAHRQEIIDLIRSHQTIVLCGETGSGKSTQLPKLCLEAGLGRRAMIGHTQPRRLAARAVSNRVAEELGSKVGDLVGFKIRFTDATQPQTLIKVMTDGVLLAETQRDRFLDQYDAIIIDEAHERSLNIDFLLGYIRQLTAKRPELKLIITSATIDPERFANHFADDRGPAPIVEVSGRTYPVDVRYAPITLSNDNEEIDEQTQLAAIARGCDELLATGDGDILVFLPTERDIRLVAKHLRGHHTRYGSERGIEILPLYARLTQSEQNKIFERHTQRRIVLATNVAESSLTVPGIHFVLDTGLARISRYAPRSKVQRLPIEAISQASANQRSGRCGRLGPGVCIRLYSREDFESRSQFTTPEIRRSDLANVLLQSLVLRLGPLEDFPLLDPPTPEAIRDAQKTLLELDAIEPVGRRGPDKPQNADKPVDSPRVSFHLTDIGRRLGELPCDPRVGRMLIEAHDRKCLPEVLVIAAALESQDVRMRPAGQAPQADEAHAMFADPHSDFLSYIRLWEFYEKLANDLGRSRLQKALNQKFLSSNHFREWSDIVRQLKDILHQAGMKIGPRRITLPPVDSIKSNRNIEPEPTVPRSAKLSQDRVQHARPAATIKRPEGYEAIHQSLLTGLLSGVAMATDKHEYRAAGGMTVSLWPGSALFRRKPKWIMAAELVETTRRFVRTIAEIDVEWVERAAGDLLKHSYSDPHWSSKSGSAMVYQRSTLYGLPIIAGRRVNLSPIDPNAARDLLIEHGLVGGEWNCREKFYVHNQELLADLHELAQRTRQRDYIIDKYHLAAFYNQRVPSSVTDLQSLRGFLLKHQGTAKEQALWMKPEDLLNSNNSVHEELEVAFPNVLDIGATQFPISYQFEPGSDVDGITITVPQAALRQISDERLGWLVPGLLEDKLLHLIRSLPKPMRTHFVPAPDAAKQIATKLASIDRQRPFSAALCEVMTAYAGIPVQPSDFEWSKLPIHLRCLVRVIDDHGKLIEAGRDVADLQARLAPADSLVSTQSAVSASNWKDRKIQQVDFESLPDKVAIKRGGLLVAAFPTLVDNGDAVELRLVDNPIEAEQLAVQGWMRLFSIKHHRNLRGQVAHLPQLERASMLLGHLMKADELRSQLQDLICRIAFIDGKPPLRNNEDFEARNLRSTEQISVATQQIAAWLPKLGEAVHQVRLRMEAVPDAWREVRDDIRDQFNALFTRDFLQFTPWNALVEYPRYLRGIELRLDKLKSGGLPKDRQLRTPIVTAWTRLKELRSQAPPPSPELAQQLEKLRWMIEEFRISVFAQTLGTRQPVSEKRINEFLASLKQ
jgi:ATP-dependent helicase HrpA